jgi:hypothetical protein
MDQRPHIVVVEDEATQRQLLCDYLDKQTSASAPPKAAARCAVCWSANCRRWCCSTSACPAKTASRWRGGSARRADASASSW